MPKAKPATQKAQTLLILSNGAKRVLIPRPPTYKLIDIASESWELVVDSMTSVSVSRHECSDEDKLILPHKTAVADSPLTASPDKLVLNCLLWDGITVSMRPHRVCTGPISNCSTAIALVIKIPRRLSDGDQIWAVQNQLGGKPVIYLYSPAEIDATVALTLTREWSFSVIYPVVPAKIPPSNVGQRIEWKVRTHLDGSLTETNTGLDVAYLFWEAHTNHGIPASPPPSPLPERFDTTESFSPLTSSLSPTDSVLIAVTSITPYLDKVLLALGLHTEERTSFITYWLPSFLKHTQIALRFVPQAAYEPSAALDISPAPDVVTRVFMLFRGITDDALDGWSEADALHDGERWRQVVGVDVARAADATLFRVLEWGGMEVLGR
ncbi:hypothetical protein C8R46DRAFT_1246546 [Mycena filopes]|nr:hypothetical protein C8R46DRAFT_1246546 [Mycena filopes]